MGRSGCFDVLSSACITNDQVLHFGDLPVDDLQAKRNSRRPTLRARTASSARSASRTTTRSPTRRGCCRSSRSSRSRSATTYGTLTSACAWSGAGGPRRWSCAFRNRSNESDLARFNIRHEEPVLSFFDYGAPESVSNIQALAVLGELCIGRQGQTLRIMGNQCVEVLVDEPLQASSIARSGSSVSLWHCDQQC